ncbi:MAG: glycosyltransferase [Planctomycetota bacterium]
MRFLLVSIGSMGDTFPFVTVGEALKRRGHEVFICCNGQFQKFVESRGLKFVESLAASEYQTFIENQKHWSQRRALKGMGEILINQVEKVYHAIADHHLPGQTVVAAQGYAVGARVAQEKLGIPTATVHLQPLWFRSIHNHPELADWCPLWFPRTIDRILDFFIDRNIGRPVNAFRATLGLAPMNYVLKYWWNSPDLVMGLFPSWYESPQPDWPKNVLLTGFPIPPYNPDLFDAREVEAFLNAGDRPIVFNQSSVTLDDRYFAICAEVARKVGRRAIFLTPHLSQLPTDLPNTIKSFPFVPLEWLLPRSALHVHHGGVGTLRTLSPPACRN